MSRATITVGAKKGGEDPRVLHRHAEGVCRQPQASRQMLFRSTVSHSDWTANAGKYKFGNVFLTESAEQEVASVLGRDLGHPGVA